MAAIPPKTDISGLKTAVLSALDGAFTRGVKQGRYLEQQARKKGKWISIEPEIELYSCSLCERKILMAKCNYCPECGAKMDAEVKSGEENQD